MGSGEVPLPLLKSFWPSTLQEAVKKTLEEDNEVCVGAERVCACLGVHVLNGSVELWKGGQQITRCLEWQINLGHL